MTSARRSTADARLRLLAETVLQPGFAGTAPPDWLRRRLAAGLGGVLLFARNTPDAGTTAALTAALRAENPDVIVAADEEGGQVTRLESATGSSWPGNAALGHVDDPELTEQVAAEQGRFLARAGIDLDYAPTADVNSDPANPVIGVRSFGADAAAAARHTAAFVRGMQGAGVAACAKHFPGHGDTRLDSHHDLPLLTLDRETLHRRELLPFRAAISAGVRSVMAGHLLVPCLDPGNPASLSRPVLTGLLRRELGFQGLIVTDALEMKAVHRGADLPGLAVRAVAAGADVLCVGAQRTDEELVLALRDALVAAVHNGSLDEERLADAARRVGRLADWRRVARRSAGTPAPVTADERAPLGRLAARRALELHRRPGAALPLGDAPVVVTLAAPAHAALDGPTAWGAAGPLAELRPGTTGLGLSEDRLSPEVLDQVTAERSRPLVVVVRDAARLAWVGRALRALLERRPDAVVVELGWPGDDRPGAVHLATRSPSPVAARAAAELLCGRLPE
ncbi:glycoside hydrolase family 3 protein [Streptacidiphilus griseoplanus]|uniref:glycoside hydrolase family 3 protein n=1 Tax=Peterkaempfera griseoplana TaxID=66896 RepID=UPI0006E122C7|nr:glycoside hydrolase family 3 N-terminal domain-containing protein [Peterkaempfera griseoplana]